MMNMNDANAYNACLDTQLTLVAIVITLHMTHTPVSVATG